MLRAVARGAPGTIVRRIYSPPAPGAGNDLTFPVPQHRVWQLLGVACTFGTDVNVSNRFPALTLEDVGGAVLARIASPTAITASLTPVVTWTPGVGAATVVAASFAALTLPESWYMMPQEKLTITGHTHAGDTITDVRVTVLETNWGEPAYERELELRIQDHFEAIHEWIEGLR